MPQLATSPMLVDLTERVNAAEYDWNDFFEGERAVATVEGRVLSVPALVDNLAVVYNKDLFAAAGVPEPTNDWTWRGPGLGRRRGHRPGKQGVRSRVPGGRERDDGLAVHRDALGGAAATSLNEDNTEAIFNQGAGRAGRPDARRHQRRRVDVPRLPAGLGQVRSALQRRQDRHGHHRPLGPRWVPGRQLRRGVHARVRRRRQSETIAGPDNWVIFDNGPEHVDAAWEFLSYMTAGPGAPGLARHEPHADKSLGRADARVPGVLREVPGD